MSTPRVHVISYQRAVAGDAPPPEEIRRLFTSGTELECREAGMRRWNSTGLLLIPAAWVDAVPDDLLVESINGMRSTVGVLRSGDGAWDDSRFGFLAHGWNPSTRSTERC